MTSDQEQARTATVTTPTDREIRVERVFDAPRDRVFAVFTDPKLIPEWWRTKLTTTLLFDTSDERDGLLAHGGERGMNESYARVDALLARLAAR